MTVLPPLANSHKAITILLVVVFIKQHIIESYTAQEERLSKRKELQKRHRK